MAKTRTGRSAQPDWSTLDLTQMQLADGEWCIVSADPEKPLTEKQARAVLISYRVIAEILVGKC
jgi:hypothetical protein